MHQRLIISLIFLAATGCRTTATSFRGGLAPIPPVYQQPPQITQRQPIPPQYYPPRTPAPPYNRPVTPTPWRPPTIVPGQPPYNPPVTPPVTRLTGCELPAQLAPGDYDYRKHIKFHRTHSSTFTKQNGGSTHYQDVMEHAPIVNGRADRHLQPVFGTFDLVTNAHETLHFYAHSYGTGIFNNIGYHYIYDTGGQGARLQRFSTTKSQVAQIIPDEIRNLTSISSSSNSPLNIPSISFPTYLFNSFHKQAGHLFEEWVCYEGDMRVLYELTKANYRGHIEQSLNLADMLYFATATVYLIQQNESAYFNRQANPADQSDFHQLKAVYAMLMEKSTCLLDQSQAYTSQIQELPLQQYLMNHLRTSNEAAKFRTMLKNWYGNVWTQRVLRF